MTESVCVFTVSASDLELKIKLQESEAVTCKVADKGQDYRLPCVFSSQELGACGL